MISKQKFRNGVVTISVCIKIDEGIINTRKSSHE